MKSAKNLLVTALTLAATTAGVWAQTSSAAPPPKKKHKVAAQSASPAASAADIQALKDALAAQQQQIQQLTQQLQQNAQAWQQAQQQSQQQVQQAEAAELLGVSVRTVQRRWQTALLKLHQVLQGGLPGL